MAGRVYPLENFLEQKVDETINAITILADTTASDCETNTNLPNTVASLENKPSLANKHIVAPLRDNAHLESLLGQFMIGGSMS